MELVSWAQKTLLLLRTLSLLLSESLPPIDGLIIIFSTGKRAAPKCGSDDEERTDDRDEKGDWWPYLPLWDALISAGKVCFHYTSKESGTQIWKPVWL
ncbi:hypothetical protein EDD85DRAFT_825966 [Armillaria nabsnona]|nr:hypothetical protein EDD85DRAFT_825966 [Armillaria nabsnona]